jgi:hypothetical protein
MRSDPDGEMVAPLLPAASGADEENVRLNSRSDRGEPAPSELEALLIDHSLQTATLLRLSRSRPAELRLFRLLL